MPAKEGGLDDFAFTLPLEHWFARAGQRAQTETE